MAYDEGLAQRIREEMQNIPEVSEKKMFGGLAFMVHGNMCAGIVGDTLMLRVGPEQYAQALMRPHARKMDFTGKPMNGFVYVDAAGFESDDDLKGWIKTALHYVVKLPSK
jgi:TfoX/Sxy family transcriptional regulator of competence genes